MRENNRKPIEKCRKKLPQFTTMNVIDGQAGLVIYSSLIFYSLTIDNILNIIVLLILAGVTISTLTGDNGILKRAQEGLTTPKQIRFLESRGFQHVGTWQFDTAKKLIDRIAGNGWRIPHDIIPSEYKGA